MEQYVNSKNLFEECLCATVDLSVIFERPTIATRSEFRIWRTALSYRLITISNVYGLSRGEYLLLRLSYIEELTAQMLPR